jgi:hypothetical protein
MKHAIQFFEQNPNLKKQIFVATDDTLVINSLEIEYKEFKFTTNADRKKDPTQWMHHRYSSNEFLRILIDIWLLSDCDLFIGTFSSHVSRLVFEFIQFKNKKNQKVVSLDSEWYNGVGVNSDYPKK